MRLALVAFAVLPASALAEGCAGWGWYWLAILLPLLLLESLVLLFFAFRTPVSMVKPRDRDYLNLTAQLKAQVGERQARVDELSAEVAQLRQQLVERSASIEGTQQRQRLLYTRTPLPTPRDAETNEPLSSWRQISEGLPVSWIHTGCSEPVHIVAQQVQSSHF
eukprot:TRINITY_DN22523_c0_g1_i1.p1 TRINITY_DN22523_c0_g1~~TRINITY_DN22523_c0_g1_i1.p1  ORF type:complete len:175 (-),score=24.95 TRINITY_DN22523_c0_g1_i1:86-577(-)